MTFNNMPPIYEAQAIAEAEKVIRLSENAHQLESGKFADQTAKILRKMPDGKFNKRNALGGFLITWVLVAVVFGGILEPLEIDKIIGDDMYVPVMIVFWIVGTIVIGLLLNRAKRKLIARKIAALEKKMDALRQKQNDRYAAVRREAAEESKAYRLAFEEEARKLSLRFAESETADTVVEWAIKDISRMIDSADRAGHYEQVEILSELTVCTDRIRLDIWTKNGKHSSSVGSVFSFEENRCRPLNKALEQAALAHVLGSKLQVALMMQYPQDPSGSVPAVTSGERYQKNDAIACVTYRAANLNYKAEKSW